MNSKRLLTTFFELVAIDSPSLEERQLCDYLTGQLNELGFSVREDDVAAQIGGNSGNLYGYLEGDADLEPLLFGTHMDTVEPSRGKKAILHDDGTITSDGTTILAADDFAGIAAILEAVRSIREEKLPHRPIELLFCVGEEIFGKGSILFDYSRLKSKEAYVLDLTGPVGRAANKAPTLLSFTVTITGRAAHSGFAPQEGIHAIAAAADAIGRIPMGHIDGETTCNVGTIQGGAAPNIVPEQCVVQGEIRSYSHKKALAQMDLVGRIFQEAAQSIGATVKVEPHVNIEAYEISSDHPVVTRYRNACESLGLPYELVSTFGGSDNNHFVNHGGISGIVIATAMNNCHSCAEYTTVEELERITRLVKTLMTGSDH